MNRGKNKNYSCKNQVTIYLTDEILQGLEKRAKKEMLSVQDLIEEILRRSVLSYKGNTSNTDKVDDKFLTYFSRKNLIMCKTCKAHNPGKSSSMKKKTTTKKTKKK